MHLLRRFYEKFRMWLLAITNTLIALIWFRRLNRIIAVSVRVKLGSPVRFIQPRPGRDERIITRLFFVS